MTPLKGKALIAQSGGCTAVINQSLAGAAAEARVCKSISQVLGSRFGVEGILNRELVNLSKVSGAHLSKIANHPSAALGSSRYKLKTGDEHRLVEALKKDSVRYFFMIGGNDTAETLLRISRAAEALSYELRTVHIPKTIDNDLVETDHCPGYGSIARFAAISTQEAGLDTEAMRRVDPVKIIEFMGRNSGWIVAASALLKKRESDPPHLLCLPEVPFEETAFLTQVDRILGRIGYCIVVISETIRDKAGRRIGERKDGVLRDPFGHPYVDGAAQTLARLVENRFKIRARFDKPGTLSRMSMPYVSEVDQAEAFQCGKRAVQWALKGQSRVMVGLKRRNGPYQIDYVPIPLDKIPGRERYLPPSFFDASRAQVLPAFVRYAMPLIGRNPPDYYRLPKGDSPPRNRASKVGRIKNSKSLVPKGLSARQAGTVPLLIMLSLLTTGCAAFDAASLEHQMLTSDQRVLTESQASEIVSQVLKDQKALYEDPAQQARIGSMLDRLGRAAGSTVPFKARLYQDTEANAFSIGGKYLFISSTMLKMFPADDDLLAGVLGHEMAHDMAGHHARQQTEAYWRGVATDLAKKIGKQHAQVVDPLAQSVSSLMGLRFSRSEEKEADILGTYYAMRAGYQPEGLTRFFETTNNNMNSNKWVSFISSHPYHPSRIATIRLVIQVLRKEISLDQAAQMDAQTARVLRSLGRLESIKTPA